MHLENIYQRLSSQQNICLRTFVSAHDLLSFWETFIVFSEDDSISSVKINGAAFLLNPPSSVTKRYTGSLNSNN